MALDETPLLDSTFKCLPAASPMLVDNDWKDEQNRDCQVCVIFALKFFKLRELTVVQDTSSLTVCPVCGAVVF